MIVCVRNNSNFLVMVKVLKILLDSVNDSREGGLSAALGCLLPIRDMLVQDLKEGPCQLLTKSCHVYTELTQCSLYITSFI